MKKRTFDEYVFFDDEQKVNNQVYKIKKGRVIPTRPFTNQQIQIDYYLNLDDKNM